MSVLPETDGAAPLGSESGLPRLEVPGPHRNVLDRLAELARAVPDQLAVGGDDEQLTFAELYQRVRLLRSELTQLVPADPADRRPIGLMAEQNAATVAAYLAIVTSGAPCVILDVVLPPARLAQIVELAGATAVLADEARTETAAALPGIAQVRGLLPTTDAPETEGWDVGLDDPATIIYTSGTTGVPKGVVYSQRTALSCAFTGAVGWLLRPRDRIALIVPTAYAGGQILIFTGVLNGATVLVRDPRLHGAADLARWFVASRLDTMLCSPALLRALDAALPAGELLPTVRVVVTSAEKLYGRDVTSFRRHLGPDATFVNVMGTSETDSISTFAVRGGDPAPEGALPAGVGVPLREIEVLDEADQPVPTGEVGLLSVTSANFSVGYWRNPEATAQRYQRLPDGRTRYRTGDRARMGADGVLEVLGRADDAVKIRGYLVEPGEVETALRALPDVHTAVVRAVTGADGLPRLVAWVVPQSGQRTPSPAGVRAAVGRSLPDWMVPRDVVVVPELPVTERGKVDVRALPPVPDRPAPQPPATPEEAVLERIWAPILHLDRVGRDESFTSLGGDSLAVEEMLAAVHARRGTVLTTADLAEHPTLQDFAALLAPVPRTRAATRPGVLVRLRSTGSRPPLFCLAGAGGAASSFEALAGALGPEQPVYGLQVNGLENRGVPDWTVGRTARRYARLIEDVAPTGPVLLAGHSLGGLFALATAQLLRARGREVAELIVLDTFLPRAAGGTGLPKAAEGPEAEARREGPALGLWSVRLRLPVAGLVRFAPQVHKEVMTQQGARVAKFHRPRPWAGRSLVVLSDENGDGEGPWGSLLTGEHAVHHVAADHVAMLRRPHVQRTADLITAEVDRLLAR